MSALKQIVAALAMCLPLAGLAQTEPAKPAETPPAEAPKPAPAPPAVKLTWYGIVHTAAYSTSSRASSNVFAATATQGGGRGALIIAANASRFGLRLGLPEVGGATLSGVFEMDFRGGWTSTNTSAYTSAALRLRKAYGSAVWKTGMGSVGIGAGQEFTIVAPVAGVSAGYLADQLFTNAGNPNRRHPQFRLFGDVGFTDEVALTAAAAVIHPADVGTATNYANDTVFEGAGVRGRSPDLEGRVALQYKKDKKPVVEVGAGYAYGKERQGVEPVTDNVNKTLFAADVNVNLGLVQVMGEWFTAKNADVYTVNIGGATRGTAAAGNLEANGTTGFWAQVVLTPTPLFQVTGGFGQEKPKEGDLGDSATAITKNTQLVVGAILNPSKNWQAGLEWMRTKTTRGSGTAASTDDDVDQVVLSNRFSF